MTLTDTIVLDETILQETIPCCACDQEAELRISCKQCGEPAFACRKCWDKATAGFELVELLGGSWACTACDYAGTDGSWRTIFNVRDL